MMCTVFSMSAFCLLVVGVFVLVCRRFGRYVSWCLRYMMCTVFSMSAFCLLVVGVFVLVCRRFRVYDVCCF